MNNATIMTPQWVLHPFGCDFMVRRIWPRSTRYPNGRIEVMPRPDGEPRTFRSEATARAAIAKADRSAA